MWVLHARIRRVRHRVPPRQPSPDRRPDPRRALREPLPLHRLPGDRNRGAARSRSADAVVTNTHASTSSGAARFVGQRVPRHEDARFLTGRGAFVDDIALPGTLHAAFVRSDVARGTITSVDIASAAGMPGVVAVFTASELNPLVREWWVDFEGPEGASRPFRLLADHDARFVGEPIAMVVADSRYQAEDALEAVEVDLDPRPAIVDVERALDDGVPPVHPDRESNLVLELPTIGAGDVDAVFAAAPRVFTETYRQHRYACVPMETRGTLASWDPYRQELTDRKSTRLNSSHSQISYAVFCL